MNGDFFAWLFGILFFAMYIFCLFTVCMVTFQKGHVVLGIVGIFIPFLWLIGAIIPARRGSRWDLQQRMQLQAQAGQAPS
jgi:hypothetical protein